MVISFKIFHATLSFLEGANENVAGRFRPIRNAVVCDVIGRANRFLPRTTLKNPGFKTKQAFQLKINARTELCLCLFMY